LRFKGLKNVTDEKPIYKNLSWPVLFLIPTILVILLFWAIMGAIAGFMSTPEMLENEKRMPVRKALKLLK
jgi:choline-glycine betaine transporter